MQEEGAAVQTSVESTVVEKDDAEPVATKKKYPSKKVNWLITYGASGPSMTARMLNKQAVLSVDECYTSRDSAHKYTLIHLTKPVYQTVVKRAVEFVCENNGMILNHVYGMQAIQSGTTERFGSIRDNHLLKWMVKDFEKGSPDFELWVAPDRSSKALFRDDMNEKERDTFHKLMLWPRKRLVSNLLLERENAKRLQLKVDEQEAMLKQLEKDSAKM